MVYGNNSSFGTIDLSPFEYLLVYKDNRDNPPTINTWTLPEGSFQMNYKQMKKSEQKGEIEFVSIYKKMSDKELLDVMID